jgi:hypothetical protein
VVAWSGGQACRPFEDIHKNIGVGETAYDASFKGLARTQNASLDRGEAQLLPPERKEPPSQLAGDQH